ALRRSLPRRVDRVFRVLQLGSAAAYSLGHGSNDAQKTMGIIVGLLVAEQQRFVAFPVRAFHLTDAGTVPLWVIVACGAAMGLGTMSGGWRIVKTMGQRLTKLTPFGGFCAETGAAFTISLASYFGIPVSTTHTITGAISGVGAAHRLSAVRWGVAGRIVWAWILTIPAAAGIAGLSYVVLRGVLRSARAFSFARSIIFTPGAYSTVGACVSVTSRSMQSRMRRAISMTCCRDCWSSGWVMRASCSSSWHSARIVARALLTSWRIAVATWLTTSIRSPSIALA